LQFVVLKIAKTKKKAREQPDWRLTGRSDGNSSSIGDIRQRRTDA